MMKNRKFFKIGARPVGAVCNRAYEVRSTSNKRGWKPRLRDLFSLKPCLRGLFSLQPRLRGSFNFKPRLRGLFQRLL